MLTRLRTELETNVDSASFALCAQGQAAFLEHSEHSGIFRKDLGDEFLKTRLASEADQVAEQRRTNALSLILVDDGESRLSASLLQDDVAPAAGDDRARGLVNHRHEGDVGGEINVQKE